MKHNCKEMPFAQHYYFEVHLYEFLKWRYFYNYKYFVYCRFGIIVISNFFEVRFFMHFVGILALSGHHVPPEVYAWAAVFILPINSALNPILYTFSAIIRRKVNS